VSMALSTDDDVISRAKAGDQAAWSELYAAHAGRLAVWLRTLPTGDAATDHDDIPAAAGLAAARRIADFTGSSSDYAGWLFAIARNISMNTRARSTRRATSPASTDGAETETWGASPDWSSRVDESEWARGLLRLLPRREA